MGRHGGGGKGFVIGAIFGGVLGGVAALLLAPKSGDRMRKDLCKKYHEVCDKAQDVVDDFRCKTNKLVEKAKDISDDTKEAVNQYLNKK